ncbi:putative GTP pyrophosphokinase [Actinoalloteichus hoggarensis]|uniref:GTP pyrophosphokinase YwaC n=1 Tax=Actinoalloteichus hoggarensis TaxID=1470176 RepID=A0A221W824_9PSEU|nr:GTP pyrophosphokinase family protein [Actinoalloteichus hoggarensis]ASO21679.1 GTP pyrophosphokinase YwaC [Actinoalloteichus hoggarensis]MBB5922273.1 putative GTP pyrophosphokinase [Actinoalloteichus hoggarensis]
MDIEEELDGIRRQRARFTDFMLGYKFAIDEMITKINILREDFNNTNEYNPIEHISSRLKTPRNIVRKVRRKNFPLSFESMRDNILDIAGVRVTCSFISDIYKIRDMIAEQEDVTIFEERDYIARPKASGYQSLHLLVEIPVFRARGTERIPVELQIRSIAMDFWASLEHKIYYKYDGHVPDDLQRELIQAADVASRLDRTMEGLHESVRQGEAVEPAAEADQEAEERLREAEAAEFLNQLARETAPAAG